MSASAHNVLLRCNLSEPVRRGHLIEIDMASQQQSSNTPADVRDEWRTPLFVYDWIDTRFEFGVDLAASHVNHLSDAYVTRGENSLVQDWSRLAGPGFCNPPYSDIDPWLEKAVTEARKGFTSVFLIPTPNGEDRYGEYVFDVASEIIFITGRLAFLRPDGAPVSGNTRGSCFVVYRGNDLGSTRYRHVLRDAMRTV